MPTLQDQIWFAPMNVIHHFFELGKTIPDECKKDKSFRKAEEMNSVAVMLVGLQASQGRKYWLQAVDDKEESPDVRTGTFVPPTTMKANDFLIQDVEVVTYEKNSQEGFLNFLMRTKLTKGKSYDAQTTILCCFQRDAVLPPLSECQRVIGATVVRCSVMILGKTSPTEDTYKITQVYPQIALEIEFSLSEALKESHTGVLRLRRGSQPQSEYLPDEKHFPFEKLGFKPTGWPGGG